MNANVLRKWLVAGVLVALPALSVSAQEAQARPSAPTEPTPALGTNTPSEKPLAAKADQSKATAPDVQNPERQSVGVGEVVKMVHAGVSKDVIKTYIQSAQIPSHLGAAELVSLKEQGVPDDLTVALIKRGAELAAQEKAAGANPPAPAKVSGSMSFSELAALLRSSQPNSGQLDPEGYDYFRYYYLLPRSIAAANERIYSSYPFFPSYGPYPHFLQRPGPGW